MPQHLPRAIQLLIGKPGLGQVARPDHDVQYRLDKPTASVGQVNSPATTVRRVTSSLHEFSALEVIDDPRHEALVPHEHIRQTALNDVIVVEEVHEDDPLLQHYVDTCLGKNIVEAALPGDRSHANQPRKEVSRVELRLSLFGSSVVQIVTLAIVSFATNLP